MFFYRLSSLLYKPHFFLSERASMQAPLRATLLGHRRIAWGALFH